MAVSGVWEQRRDSTVCGEADPFSYKHKLGQILRRYEMFKDSSEG